MSFNPYAPPANLPYQPPSMASGPDGTPQPWGVEEVIKQAWEIVKVHWVALIFGPLIGGFIAGVPTQIIQSIGQATKDKDTIIATLCISVVLNFFVQAYFTAGAIQMAVAAARGRQPEVMQIFSGGHAYWRLLGTNLLVTLAVLGGFILLIVPGFILAIGFSMAPYYAVDGGKSPVEAMRASWDAMNGQKGQFFVFMLASFALALVGLMACCVGLLPAQAVIMTATAIIFTRISGRSGNFTSTPSPFAAFGPGGQGPGGYGPGPTPPPGGGWGAA